MTTTANDAADRIDGGTGDDTIAISAGSSFVFNTDDTAVTNVEFVTVGSAGSVTLSGQTDGFTVNAGGGNETVVGSEGADSISGSLGNDVITGGAGADTIDGGAGTDTVSYADVTTATSHNLPLIGASVGIQGMAINLSDTAVTEADVFAATTFNPATVGTGDLAAGSAEYLVSAADEDAQYVVDTLSNVETVIGSALVDYIQLGSGGMTATGGAGADVMIGGSGNDTFNAEMTDALISGGAGTDTAVFTAGGTLAADMTGVENAIIAGSTTAYVFTAQTTALNISMSDNVAVTVTGGGAANTITTGDGADNVTGAAAAVDTISTGAGNDTIDGLSGNDIINAGAGNDQISMTDNDIVTGGAGRDTFIANAGALGTILQTITDFEAGVADTLDITLSGPPAVAADITAATVQTDFAAAAQVAINGVLADSYLVGSGGLITFFDEAATFGTTELIAQSTADVQAIAAQIALEGFAATASIFKLDEDGDGVAESSVVYNATGTELIKLVGVTADTGLNITATAGDIHII